jgi:hypothetical protein
MLVKSAQGTCLVRDDRNTAKNTDGEHITSCVGIGSRGSGGTSRCSQGQNNTFDGGHGEICILCTNETRQILPSPQDTPISSRPDGLYRRISVRRPLLYISPTHVFSFFIILFAVYQFSHQKIRLETVSNDMSSSDPVAILGFAVGWGGPSCRTARDIRQIIRAPETKRKLSKVLSF